MCCIFIPAYCSVKHVILFPVEEPPESLIQNKHRMDWNYVLLLEIPHFLFLSMPLPPFSLIREQLNHSREE